MFPLAPGTLFILDRFEKALESAREILRKARSTFQEAAIATEHTELFGYGGKSVKGKGKGVRGKKKSRAVPWTKQFYCQAYSDQYRVPTTDEELDELYHAGLGLKKIKIPVIRSITNNHFRKIIVNNFPPFAEAGGFDFLCLCSQFKAT